MKNRHGIHVLKWKHTGRIPVLLFLSGCFLCGSIAGCIWADSVAGSGGAALATYINTYLTALREGMTGAGSLWATVWETARWPLIIVILAFTAPGILAIPVLFVVRGFLLSFSVACFIRVLGSTGAILAFLLFGISGALSLPVLFVLGMQGIAASRQLCLRLIGARQKTGEVYGREYFARCGLSAVLLSICVCLEQSVIPIY